MGEFSKRIGDVGEDIVLDFLALIGWINPVRNFDIQSIDPEKHEKYSHGKNGTLTVNVDHDGQENFGLVFRYTGGTRTTTVQGLYLDFQLAFFGNQANITLYQNGVSIGTIVGKAYAAPYTDAKIKVE